MADRWLQGIFLGYRKSSSSYILGIDTGIATSRAVQRRPLENRWDLEAISQLKATPWSTMVRRDPEVYFEQEAPRDEPAVEVEPATNPHRLRLDLKDFTQHGFSANCRQCDHMQQHRSAKGGLQHTDTCRSRMMVEIGKSVAGQARLARCEERITEALARVVERSDLDDQRARRVGEPVANSAPLPTGPSTQPTAMDNAHDDMPNLAPVPTTAISDDVFSHDAAQEQQQNNDDDMDDQADGGMDVDNIDRVMLFEAEGDVRVAGCVIP